MLIFVKNVGIPSTGIPAPSADNLLAPLPMYAGDAALIYQGLNAAIADPAWKNRISFAPSAAIRAPELLVRYVA
jgi:hypothetical protein